MTPETTALHALPIRYSPLTMSRREAATSSSLAIRPTCLVISPVIPAATSSDSSHPPLTAGAWIGLALGVAGMLLAVVLTVVITRRSRRMLPASRADHPPGADVERPDPQANPSISFSVPIPSHKAHDLVLTEELSPRGSTLAERRSSIMSKISATYVIVDAQRVRAALSPTAPTTTMSTSSELESDTILEARQAPMLMWPERTYARGQSRPPSYTTYAGQSVCQTASIASSSATLTATQDNHQDGDELMSAGH